MICFGQIYCYSDAVYLILSYFYTALLLANFWRNVVLNDCLNNELKFCICRWLPGIHLKRVVLFGCPSLEKNNVFAAKRLRNFFEIQENTVSHYFNASAEKTLYCIYSNVVYFIDLWSPQVCSQCMLKDSCKYANMNVWQTGKMSLLLVDVMKVITLYALDQVPPKLAVPDDVNDSINQLLKQAIKLSKTTWGDFENVPIVSVNSDVNSSLWSFWLFPLVLFK